MTRSIVRSRALALTISVVAVTALLGACSSSSDSSASPTPASPTPDPCAALQTLQGSIQSLLSIQPIQQGTDAVKAAVTQVDTDLSAAATAASADIKPEVDALKQSVQAMTDTIANAGTAGALATAGQLATELPAVGTAWSALIAAASDLNCGLATPSA